METEKVVLQIEGMNCLSCAATIEKSLSKMGGLKSSSQLHHGEGKLGI